MHCLFLTCSESSAIDAPTGRLSTFHIMEELTATSFPVVVPQLHLVAMLEKASHDPSTAAAKAVVSLNGAILGTPLSLAIDFRERDRTKVVANIQGIVLQRAGKLAITLEYNGAPAGRWEINVIQVSAQQSAPSQSAVIAPDNPRQLSKREKPRKDEVN